jgi:hypothetical protein
MRRTSQALSARLPDGPGAPAAAWRRAPRLVLWSLAVAGLAWVAQATLAADRSRWPARLVDGVLELLRAAWIP